MSEKKVGIDKLSKAIILAINSGFTIAGALKDGFQPLQDLLAFLGKGTEIQQMIKQDGAAIKEQFLDVDKEEGAELNKIVAESFQVTNKKAERLVEAGFNILWGVVFFVDEINEPGDEVAGTTSGK